VVEKRFDDETGNGSNPHPNPRPGGYPPKEEKKVNVMYKVGAALLVVVLIAAVFG